MLTALRSAIDAYRASISLPRQVITTTSAATTQLDAAFARAEAVLTKQLDKLMELYRLTHPTFYQEYQSAREIIGPTGGSPPAAPPPATSGP